MTQHSDQLQSASQNVLQKERSIARQVPDFQAEDRPKYLVEYGVRITDQALVFHFYPKGEDWDPDWKMDKRLEHAIPEVFQIERIGTDYVMEYSSFCVIAGGYGSVPDPRLLAKRFLDAVDAAAV
jgi:hypothetical protein